MLPLIVPPMYSSSSSSAGESGEVRPSGRCWLRVADQKVYLEEGKVRQYHDAISAFICACMYCYCVCYRVLYCTAYTSPPQSIIGYCYYHHNVILVQCILFDDSFEHEAGYDVEEGGNPMITYSMDPAQSQTQPVVRVVLIADIWHPDFTNEEVNLQLVAYARLLS